MAIAQTERRDLDSIILDAVLHRPRSQWAGARPSIARRSRDAARQRTCSPAPASPTSGAARPKTSQTIAVERARKIHGGLDPDKLSPKFDLTVDRKPQTLVSFHHNDGAIELRRY